MTVLGDLAQATGPAASVDWDDALLNLGRPPNAARADLTMGYRLPGSILALVYLLLLWVDGFSQGLSDDSTIVGRWLMESAGLERARREQLALPSGLLLKFAVLILSVPLIMLQ